MDVKCVKVICDILVALSAYRGNGQKGEEGERERKKELATQGNKYEGTRTCIKNERNVTENERKRERDIKFTYARQRERAQCGEERNDHLAGNLDFE